MNNKKNLINQIIYRSTHRGTKEMDILLGNFVKKYINKFNDNELSDLDKILYWLLNHVMKLDTHHFDDAIAFLVLCSLGSLPKNHGFDLFEDDSGE